MRDSQRCCLSGAGTAAGSLVLLGTMALTTACKERADSQVLAAGGGSESTVETRDLGRITQFLPGAGSSSVFSVDVPGDALSMTIYVANETPDRDFYLITDVRAPDGQILVEGGSGSVDELIAQSRFGQAELRSPNRSQIFDEGFASLMVPAHPRVSLTAGRWTFRVVGIQATPGVVVSSSRPSVTVLIKRGTIGAGTRGSLDLNVFFTGSQGITAANASSHPAFVEMTQRIVQIYAAAGIDVNVRPAADVAPATTLVQGETAFFGAFRATAGDAAVNLILVDSLVLASGDAAGYSGGLPGRPFVAGRPYAGVVAVSRPPGPFERRPPPGIAAAHEIGHYLGLPHTFEGVFGTGDAADQLLDTPEDFSKNLMDFGLNPDPASSTRLTPEQVFVLLRSPAVRLSGN